MSEKFFLKLLKTIDLFLKIQDSRFQGRKGKREMIIISQRKEKRLVYAKEEGEN